MLRSLNSPAQYSNLAASVDADLCMYPFCWRALQHFPHLFVINCFYELFDYRFVLTMAADWHLGWRCGLAHILFCEYRNDFLMDCNKCSNVYGPRDFPWLHLLNNSPGDWFDQVMVLLDKMQHSSTVSTKIQIRPKKCFVCLWLKSVVKIWNKLRCTQPGCLYEFYLPLQRGQTTVQTPRQRRACFLTKMNYKHGIIHRDKLSICHGHRTLLEHCVIKR